jgi:D-alanyl-D-alanine carboxypeptidase/D-alanyl-D-alanine-endopeptidase (penicillin-binding protein 4)
MKVILFLCLLIACSESGANSAVLKDLALTSNDSVLVTHQNGQQLFSWQASKTLIPASLTKLATAHLAIQKWGLDHRFYTDFLLDDDTLWVKGYGDPFLVSEEIDKLATQLKEHLKASGSPKIRQLYIDNSYFDIGFVPGRSKVADPYNAPISAVAANFNTAMLRKVNGQVESAEAQTPLTNTAIKMAYTLTKEVDRVNLLSMDNAQSNFAELLLMKLGWSNADFKINQHLSQQATLLYRHENSHTLADVLRGTLKYSNNFMANQLFLKLAESRGVDSVSFAQGRDVSNKQLTNDFAWKGHNLSEGSGLSRENLLSAKQIDDLLKALEPNMRLFQKVKTKTKTASVYAKTGTLNGVRSYAGFISIRSKISNTAVEKYRFVFNFNRVVPYRYRDQLLKRLIEDLQAL